MSSRNKIEWDRRSPLVTKIFLWLMVATVITFLAMWATGAGWLWTIIAMLIGGLVGMFMVTSTAGDDLDD